MSNLILFYSYTGNTKEIATQLAAESNADLVEIKDAKKTGNFRAYVLGCFKALRLKAWPVQALNVDFNNYDRISILSPVWAGHPAPAINAIWEQLPPGKQIEIFMVSASGSSSAKEKLEDLIKSKGSKLVKYEDIKK